MNSWCKRCEKLREDVLKLRYELAMSDYYKNCAEAELRILTKKTIELESDIEQSGGSL